MRSIYKNASVSNVPDLSGHVFMLVDQLRGYCDPKYADGMGRVLGTPETYNVAARNVGVLRQFHAAGAKVCIVYSGAIPDWIENSMGGPYLLKGAPFDFIHQKFADDAFASPDGHLAKKLRHHRIEKIWKAGFRTSDCVSDSAFSGMETYGFDVSVLEDCTANGLSFHADSLIRTPEEAAEKKFMTLEDMRRRGIGVTDSQSALSSLLGHDVCASNVASSVEPIALPYDAVPSGGALQIA